MTPRDVLAPSSVVLLLFAGYFKTIPSVAALPVDLTALAAALVALGVFSAVVGGVGRDGISSTTVMGAVISVAFVVGFGLTLPSSSDYATTKRVALVLVLLAMSGTVLLVRTALRQRVWVWAHVLVGVVLVATAATNVANGRLGENTIGAGRASGAAMIALLLLLLKGGIRGVVRKVLAAVLVGWLAYSLIQTGSRGPVFGAVAAVLLVVAFSPGNRHRFLQIGATLGALWLGQQMLSASATVGAARLEAYLSGDAVTDQARSLLWAASVRELPGSAFTGVGWGNFWQVLAPNEMLVSGYRQYPHNVIFEVAIEAGWLPALIVAVFIFAGLRRLRRAAVTPYNAALFGIAVFFVINAMVSGDVSDNRMMWAAVVMGWVVVGTTKAPARPVGVERGLGSARVYAT